MASPVHVIGGGLAGSEAAWQLARAGVPVVLHEMRPGARHRAHKTGNARRAGLLQLVPLRRCAQQRRGPAQEEMRRSARWSWRRPTPTSCRPAARSPSTATALPDAVQTALEADPLIEIRREEVAGLPDARPARRPRHRPAHLARPRRSRSARSPARTRSPSSTRSRRSCIATRSTSRSPGSSRATTRPGPAARRRLHQLPARPGAVRGASSRRCSRARSTPSRSGRRDALLRGLPADRGDGRARAGDACASGR